MPVTRHQASEAIEEFKNEYKGLSQVKFVLLENHKDFHEHYGKKCRASCRSLDRKTRRLLQKHPHNCPALAAHYDKSELAATLAHEGIGHSGINTFSCAEKRGLIDAIIESRKHPGALRDSYWKAVEDAYPNLRKSEQAEEIFSLMAETVQRVGRDSCKKPQKCTYPLDSIEIIVASKFIGPILRRKSSV